MQQLEDTVAEQEALILMLLRSVSFSSIIPPNSISPSKSDVSSNMTLDTTNTTIPDDSTWINDDLGQLSRADYEKVILVETLLKKIEILEEEKRLGKWNNSRWMRPFHKLE